MSNVFGPGNLYFEVFGSETYISRFVGSLFSRLFRPENLYFNGFGSENLTSGSENRYFRACRVREHVFQLFSDSKT
jgi:hypothetical protein